MCIDTIYINVIYRKVYRKVLYITERQMLL